MPRAAVGPTRSATPSSRPPDTRPPAGPGRGAAPRWDPVRFRSATREAPAQESPPAPAQAPAPALPEPGQWAAVITQAAIEALLGVRPVQQLSRWLATPVYQALARRAGLAQRVGGTATSARVRVRSVRVSAVDDARTEACVTVHDGRRVRAAALRIELFRGRWLVTALEIG